MLDKPVDGFLQLKAFGGNDKSGTWKVAYADFVTAMMAFFLLMWLLNATSEEQRKGLADYFNPTLPISRTSAALVIASAASMAGTKPRVSIMPNAMP